MENIDEKLETLNQNIQELTAAVKGLAAEVRETRKLTNEITQQTKSFEAEINQRNYNRVYE